MKYIRIGRLPNWQDAEYTSAVGEPHQEIVLSDRRGIRGRSEAFAHELAHSEFGHVPQGDSVEDFMQEVAAWRLALTWLPKRERSKARVARSLGTYLEHVEEEMGEGSQVYKGCVREYKKFLEGV